MSTAIVPIPNDRAIATSQWENQQLLDTIKATVCKGATDAQFRMFIEVCKSTGLNPFLKEVYYVPEKGIIMAARDGYLRVANEHPQFDGMETTVERDERNIPIKAVCRVWRKDRNHPTTCEAFFNEYKKNSPVWTQYPSAMISKVAEVLALKRSFSINGVVTEEEVGNEERGSKEAQREYLASKGINPDAPKAIEPPATSPEVIRELSDTLDQPPAIRTIEMRSAAKVAEADAVLKEVASEEKANAGKSGAHGIIRLEKLKEWRKLKDELRSFTGTDDIYKATLRAKGYEHANEIATEAHARSIWTVLGAELNRIKQAHGLRSELELAQWAHGDRFKEVLGANGCESIDDVLTLASDPLRVLLDEIKALGVKP